ncbi:glycosyltransferase family 2 protein [Dechloromonas denitrificans]|uniref:glycosyltransferase family 2 protein n=1 Tax=Dechloromonas denitrificans TaxID=281362 RepID=UPI001CF8782D|nr:glycosyltransferase [Dechloromonas denitrificans]UCV05492.1 glycosyltransferase [Dechloromonas denitrificans]UCV09838.1 glycosyltransferase [Dechloromonas denitrificans]
MERTPKISVVMPVYKVERYVAHSIQSVLDQSMDDWELILVDDASPDASAEVIAKFTDQRIRYLKHENNKGLAEARNTGIHAAQGDYIALLDSDDVALPDRLAKQVRFLENNPGVGLVGTWAELIDEAGNKAGLRSNPYPDNLLRPMLVFRNPFIASSLMIRKNALPTDLFRTMLAEDYDLTSRIAENWDIVYLPNYLIQYRINTQGLMGTRWPQIKADCWTTQQRLLTQVGISANNAEAKLHQKISHATTDGIESTEAKWAGRWMVKILQANETSRLYDQSLLRKVCEEVLLSLWRGAAKEGISTVFKARASLSELGQAPSLRQMARLAGRALRTPR